MITETASSVEVFWTLLAVFCSVMHVWFLTDHRVTLVLLQIQTAGRAATREEQAEHLVTWELVYDEAMKLLVQIGCILLGVAAMLRPETGPPDQLSPAAWAVIIIEILLVAQSVGRRITRARLRRMLQAAKEGG